MAKYQIIALALVFFSATHADESLDIDGVPGRDDWFKQKQTYTDLPRIFNATAPCPAKRFYLDCNECGCAKPGATLRACTEKGCPEVPQIVNWNNGKGGVLCPAGRKFYWKCNDCSCSSNGKSAACTRKACPNFGG